jgi:NADPH-ferrihemoprotein reductase
MEWKDDILESLSDIITLQEHQVTYEPSISISNTSVDPSLIYLGEPSEKELRGIKDKVTYNRHNPYSASIVQSIKLSGLTDRVCVHLEFDLSAVPALRYQAGDHLAVWPINPDSEVNRLLRLLDLDEEKQRKQPIMLSVRGGSTSQRGFPSPTTREALLKYYLEIGALVSREFLLILSQYAPTNVAKATLLRLGNSKDDFRREVAAHFSSVGKVMERIEPNMKWTAVPFSLLVESFNRIQPRSYSISSSPLKQPRRPSITLVVNKRHIPTLPSNGDDMFFGLTTNYLLAHHHKCSVGGSPGDPLEGPPYDLQGPRQKLGGGKVYIHVKRSTFKLPPNMATPVIMVAAGTGIAPFRGFMQERSRLAELGKPVGKMILFFGCRDDTTDYLYREEWQDYEARFGDWFKIVPAFSRLQGQRKCYVQDVLLEQRDIVLPLILDQDAAFYICGSATMATEVRRRLVEIIARAKMQSLEEADAMIKGKMKKAGLYHEDVWS